MGSEDGVVVVEVVARMVGVVVWWLGGLFIFFKRRSIPCTLMLRILDVPVAPRHVAQCDASEGV